MTDLKQFQEDSYASAFRRFPNSSEWDVLRKIEEEIKELKEAFEEMVFIKSHLKSFGEVDDGNNPSLHCPELTAVEEEWADVFFALLVLAKLEKIDIDKSLRIKNEFNKTRE